MNIIDIINKKRLKQELSKDEIDFFITNMLNDNIKDYQVSSLLMAIVLNGMTLAETINLTDAMIRSGDVIDLTNIDGITIDKHSTGGVGDKVTLVLAPLLASLGFKVAKMSGRGLGHTGGTIDKLESIKGYNVALSSEDFIKQVNDIGIAVISQTGTLAKADKKLYALRDVTGTVESIPLIASSIMSKKIASGSKYIILDVKVGSGALMKTREQAALLAKTMIQIGKKYDRVVICMLTNMDEPLGCTVGNGLEVIEARNTLKGMGPKDLYNLVVNQAAIALKMFKNITFEEGLKQAKDALANKSAYNKFLELVKAQGGDINDIKVSGKRVEIFSKQAGYIKSIDALKVGEIARSLKAGRLNKDDIIDYSVGISLNKKVGDYVEENTKLATIFYNDDNTINDIKNALEAVYSFQETKPEKEKLIYNIFY